MNEQNVSNIIEYLDQNPDQTIEVLVTNLINEGYPIEDIKAALDRQGISPLVIPGYKETIVYSKPKRSFSGMILIIAAIILTLIIAGVVIVIALNYFNRPSQTQTQPVGGVAEQQAKNLVTAPSTAVTPTAASTNTAGTNIVSMLKEALAKEDYKIVTPQLTVYLDNGEIARLEKNDGKIYLDWSGIVTILYINSKTYKTYFSQTPEATLYNNSKNTGIIPLEVIADSESGKVIWRQTGSATWESVSVPKQVLTIDPQTKLITRRTIFNANGSVAKEEMISYEKMPVTQETIKIPSDYTQAP